MVTREAVLDIPDPLVPEYVALTEFGWSLLDVACEAFEQPTDDNEFGLDYFKTVGSYAGTQMRQESPDLNIGSRVLEVLTANMKPIVAAHFSVNYGEAWKVSDVIARRDWLKGAEV